MKHIVLSTLFSAVLVSVPLGLAFADTPPPVGSTAPLDRVIAVVERTPIWQSELDELLSRVPAQGFNPDQKRLALDSLIDGVLIDHTAEALHLSAAKEEIDMAIEQVKQQNKIDDATLDRALADQHFTREQYREELAKQLRAQKVYQLQLAPKIAVSDDEVTAAWVAQSTTPKTPPSAEQRDATRQALWTQRMQAASQDWLARRRAGAHIEVKP